MASLRHNIKIWDPNAVSNPPSGQQDDDTGAFVQDNTGVGDPDYVYDGDGLFIDQGVTVERTDSGLPTIRADGQVVLPKGTVADTGIKEDMLIQITYENNDVVDASILKVVRLTDIVYVVRA